MSRKRKWPNSGTFLSSQASCIPQLPSLKNFKFTRSLASMGALAFSYLSYTSDAFAASYAFKINDVIAFGGISGAFVFAAILALFYKRNSAKWADEKQKLLKALTDYKIRMDENDAMLNLDEQVIVSMDSTPYENKVRGHVFAITQNDTLESLFDFDQWMDGDKAFLMSESINKLVQNGKAFSFDFANLAHDWVNVEGKTLKGRAIVIFKKLSQERAAIVENHEQYKNLSERLAQMEAFANYLDDPVWMRNAQGKLTYVNDAYLQMCQAQSADAVIETQKEILQSNVKDSLASGRKISHGCVKLIGQLDAVNENRLFEISEWGVETGAIGIAKPLRVQNSGESALGHGTPFKEALNLISTGVAIFDAQKTLIDCNDRFLNLWGMSRSFAKEKPSYDNLIDHLRLLSKLPEQIDFRIWKGKQTSAMDKRDIYQDNWHLPDGRTVMSRIYPENDGCFSFLIDDVSEQYKLESQYNALNMAQGETLNALSEGVAVIGSNGRLKLCNPAFMKFWHLDKQTLHSKPHIETLVAQAKAFYNDEDTWLSLIGVCVGTLEARKPFRARMVFKNGVAVEANTAPLPDGSTLITLIDVTDGVNAEKLLLEHNEALERAAKIKNDFVHHVSYTLRSPLTNIIGFAELLDSEQSGELNEKQQSYANYILSSSASLLAIINDILDLASIDEGAMELNIQSVSIIETIEEAITGIGNSLEDAGVELNLSLSSSLKTVNVDQKRLRQVLFNLLTNAIAFSSKGQTIYLSIENGHDGWELIVEDQGCGIPQEVIDKVFNPFESYGAKQKNKGLGLGLTLVRAFVELHGGEVEIRSAPNMGTRVICHWPHKIGQKPSQSVAA